MDEPISFRVADFSEQLTRPDHSDHVVYSAVMHVDGVVLQWKKALHPRFEVPIAAIRAEAWLDFLKQLCERQHPPRELVEALRG